MVCFKRKPVRYLPLPVIKRYDADLWVIPETDEAFTDYTSYLQRMEFYKQKKFVCELTGHSGLTFFDARESERRESQGIDQIFPVALKEKVLRKVQFSTVPRIDALVDRIHEAFKQDFYPGEHVTVLTDDGDRVDGTIREKGRFADIYRPDGTVERPAFSRYWIALETDPPRTTVIDDPQYITRDRKSFTKQIIKTFIKDNVTREAWNGAPWLVKDAVADHFKIDRDVPLHLQHSNKRRKTQNESSPPNPGLLNFVLNPTRVPDRKPAPKATKATKGKQTLQRPSLARDDGSPDPLESNGKKYRKAANGKTEFIVASPATLGVKSHPIPAPPPPVKYPIEDLEVPPIRDGTHRPALAYLSQDDPRGDERSDDPHGLSMKSVGPLLETWNTLNVFCQVLFLDSFTFDDYLECLFLVPEEVETELYAEIHCALLKVMVEEESEGGEVLIKLPELPDEDSSDDERSGTERSQSHTPARQLRVTKKSRRNPASKSRSTSLSRASSNVPSRRVQMKSHRAAEMMGDYDWIDRLRNRDFKDGGWEVIIVGLLDRLSLKPQLQKKCQFLLGFLAPLDQEPTQETARTQFVEIDINTRLEILQILCLLIVDVKAIRGEIETSSELMTEVRKEKMEWQRKRKTAIEELRVLDEQRKILQPQFGTPPPNLTLGHQSTSNGDDAADGTTGTEGDTPSANGDANQGPRRRGRPSLTVSQKRKRAPEPEPVQKPEPPKSKAAKHFEMVMRDLEKKKEIIRECEMEIAKAEEDLREIDCPRTRCLGKDRFMNRYWFLERNAMPWGGLPISSTADAEYANGCLWVQGPDDLERQGFIEVTRDEERAYYKKFQMTVEDRKYMEEGPTSLFNARQWGYYSDPDSLDLLIGWLDPRGHRELKLRKELQSIRGKIITHMAKRQAWLSGADERASKASTGDEHPLRISRRTKIQPVHRCRRWKNTMAIEEFGHIHSDPPKPRKVTKKVGAAKSAKRGVAAVKEKPLTRQGTRYIFS
ncbi:MAG: hypothetical protein M1823_001686 [Watsoniomyces obsoletus]|nr:MAG: hypothetical protein M1823_001686 [Watsoniomyces obsoletus]